MIGSDVREALRQAGVVPSKKLGQNFLTDPNTARWIVDQLDPNPDDFVVEVGPGTGSLSEVLIGRVRRLLLVEFDRRLAEWLKHRFAKEETVEVVHADGARFDLRPLFKERPVKFIGNLPYSAGGAILRNFLERPSPISRAVLMLQREVIDRIVAKPRTKEYGVLSLRMQSEWVSNPLKTIGPGVFYPRPAVDSTVVGVSPRGNDLPVYDARFFDELVRRGFSQRRKQLRKALPPDPIWSEVAASLGVAETARAEELDLAQWVGLCRCYDSHPLSEIPQRDDELFDVVDERDQVIGQERRSVVHEKKLLHRAVHVFILNKRGEVFLQKRSRLKDAHPGVWDSSVSGHLDAGESYESCALRELGEEAGQEKIGDDMEQLRHVAVLPPAEETGWEFVHLFEVRQTDPIRFPCSEVEAGIWLSPEEANDWISRRSEDFSSGFIACWRAWRAVR
ncbi:MAG: 16S rRNA (adenine(1518)-N(6)/adenine(1519)-N(6))-dimethyltransferase RsmA [Roseibacillus sp.]|nr:16S rRNA (adenine(1518)-N(6)/adenine(1519)-N(6))-dimethyltransferase RsmA [Roseibacillus sp.]